MQTGLPHPVLVMYVGTSPEHGFAYALIIILGRHDQNGISVLINSVHWDLLLREYWIFGVKRFVISMYRAGIQYLNESV